MANITVYHKDYCPYCKAAKQLLDKLNWQYKAIEVTHDKKRLKEMIAKSGRRTVPQIFINDEHIGGFDDFQVYVRNLSSLSNAR